jgi:hypothetical protein
MNEHEWALDNGKSTGKCGHGELNEEERQKPWLKKNSKPHSALQKVVLSKRFLNTFHYYTNFRLVIFLYVTFSTITKVFLFLSKLILNYQSALCTLLYVVLQ